MQMCQTSPIDFESIDWLTAKLPPKFHILVTCSSTEISAIVQRIESKLFQEDAVVYVNNLLEEDCELLLNETLQISKRTLTPSQKSAISEKLSKDRNLCVVSQIARIVTEWPSFYSIEGDTNKQIFNSIEDLISGILDKLEAAVGKLCAQTICNYLTLARHGLSEIELCDTLTSNDDILLDAYNNVKPPILRFPCQIWSRAKRILEPVLCNSYIGGRMLLTWRYATCAFVVRQRYLKMHEHAYTVHRDLADIFLENWKRKSPFDNSKECALYPLETDRLLSPQPLVYNDFMYNYRKLQELWFHLLKSGDIRRLKENTLCNFEYLLAMADADSIQRLLYNMGLIRSLLVDEDINILYLTLNSAGLSLNSEPLQLVNELIGRLRQLKEYFPDFIEPLMLQCMEWCDNYLLPFLVPLTSWLDNVHETHVTSMTFEHAITSSTLIPNGQHLIAASDNVIMMYHIATKRRIKTYVGHKAQVTCLYLDPLCRVIISGGNDKTICVWNIDSVDQCVQTFRDFKSNVTCLTCVSKTLVVCGTDDGDIVLRRLSDGEVTRTLELHRKRVMAVRLCKDDSILVSSSLDATVILWYTEDWTVMNIITDDTLSPVLCVDISADSAFLIVGCDNGNLHVIAMATGTIAQTIHSHTGIIQSVSICGDCHHCVAASSSGEVYLYNFRASEVIDVFKGHRSPVENVMTTDNHQLAVSVSKDEMFVWSLIKRFTKETIQYSHSGPITCMLITQDRRKLVSGSVDGLLKIWNLDISDFSDNLIGHTSIVTCLDVANDNTIVVSGSTDMTCKVWSLSMVKLTTNYRGHDQAVTGLHVLTESRLVVSLDATQKLHMWRTEDGQTMRLFAGPTTLHALAPNNQHFVSGAGDNRLQIWELSNGSVIKEVNHTDKITCLLCSKNSQLLVTGSLDCSLKVWELTTGKIVQIIVDHSSAIRCLTMTSANDVIMSSGDDGVIHVCNVHLGSVERKLTGHYDQVTSLALTADDSILVSGSIDCTVRLWNFRRGTQTTLLDAHFPVLGIALTDIADRIALRLANSNHMPILCLHNTPAKAQKLSPRRSRDKVLTSVSSDRNERRNTSTSFGISLFELSSESGGDEERMLPIKPKHGQRPRSFILASERRRVTSPSIIPLIIKHSPIKAQIQATVKAQEKHRLKFRLQRGTNKPKKSDTPRKNDSSHICAIL
ncbi:protein qui-1-like [Dreissena polymorpha]|nr:protein qui-1-like [Dreissena polymorpha]